VQRAEDAGMHACMCHVVRTDGGGRPGGVSTGDAPVAVYTDGEKASTPGWDLLLIPVFQPGVRIQE